MHDIAEFLKAHDPFSGLDEGELEELAKRVEVEYFAAGRPILALADGTEAGRIVSEARAGEVVRADDPEAIQRALAITATGELPEPDPARVHEYAYPAVAERMEEAVELARRRRGAASA